MQGSDLGPSFMQATRPSDANPGTHPRPHLDANDSKAQVRAYITDNFLMGSSAARLLDTDSFVVDSTGFLELVTYLEERYGFAVHDDEMVPENLDSLNNIAAYVQRKLEANSAASLLA
jgi:acyl carrier protein